MSSGNIVVILMYEPAAAQVEPIPLARVSDDALAVAVAESAVFEAELRAQEISNLDELLAEIGLIEIRRLRELFSLVVPGFRKRDLHDESSTTVM